MRFSSASILALASTGIAPSLVAAKNEIKGHLKKPDANHRGKNLTGRALKSKKGEGDCLPDDSATLSSKKSSSKSIKGCDLGCDSSCLQNDLQISNVQEACINSIDDSLQVGRASCIGDEACVNAALNVKVDDRSCVGSAACQDAQADALVGLDACIGTLSCGNLIAGAQIGSGSCVGKCFDKTQSNADQLIIGVLSCVGKEVCNEMDGSLFIGDTACHGQKACYSLGLSRTAVADNSCHGDYSCFQFAPDDGAIIEPNSCWGNYACATTYAKSVQIGYGSCHDNGACGLLGRDNDSELVDIGEISCRGYYSCERLAFATVGNNSCLGVFSCQGFQGDSTVSPSTQAKIGDNSCIGERACYNLTGADIGCGSCHGSSACSFGVKVVGDGACIGDNACCSPKLGGMVPEGVVPDGMCNRVTGTWVDECVTC